jgi:exosortase/archaeosortase family protein
MTIDLIYARDVQDTKRLLLVRWASLAALLVAEVLSLTLRFDLSVLAGTQGWWADLLGQAHHVPPLALGVATAVLVFGGARFRVEVQRLADQLYRPDLRLPYLLGHLTALACFVRLTSQIVEGGLAASPYAGAWFLAWTAAGLTVLAFWLLAMLPADLCLRLGRRAGGPLVAGLAVGVAAWGAGQFTSDLWQPLGRSTLWVVQGLLGLLFPDLVCRPADFTLGTTSFRVHITSSCSGYEGLGLVWVILGIYLWYGRRGLRFPQAFLLLPLGTALIWLANAVRIAALIALGSWGWPAVALGGFHSQAGWLAFNAVALGLVALTRQSRLGCWWGRSLPD